MKMLQKYIAYKNKFLKIWHTSSQTMMGIEYVEHNAHFFQKFQILSPSKAFDNSDNSLFETFLGIHSTEFLSFHPTF